MTLSNPLREPICDIQAQIVALLDPAHPKDAVYICPQNIPPILDLEGVICVFRPEGVLLTTSRAKAEAYSDQVITDEVMADILGYPESKSSVLRGSACVVVQAVNSSGAIVSEAAASMENLGATKSALEAHVPDGGSLEIVSLVDALSRRLILCRTEDGLV